ncbi:MAG: tape measure protein, partial [Acidobacteriota bacterium]
AAQLQSVTIQLGQLASKGKVLGQDLRPIIEAAPIVGKVLKDAFGTVDSEAISEKLQKAGKSSKQFVTELLTELEKLPKVIGGPKEVLENFSISVSVALAKVGEAALRLLGPAMEFSATKIERLGDAFAALPDSVQTAIIVLAGLVAAIGPIVVGFGTIIQTVAAFKSLATIATTLKAVTTALQATAVAEIAVAEGAAVAGAATAAATLPILPIVLAIAAAVGIAAIAWAAYESSTEQAAKITVDQLKATSDSRDQFQQLSTELVTATDRHQKLADVMGKLPASSQAVAGALKAEGDKVSFVAGELERLRALREAEEVAQRATLAAALADQQKEIEALRKRKAAVEDNVRIFAESAKAGNSFTLSVREGVVAIGSTNSVLASSGEKLKTLTEAEQKANAARDETAAKLAIVQRAMGGTNQSLVEFVAKGGASSSSIDSLNRGLTEFEAQQNAAKNATLNTNAALQEQADAANNAAKEVAQAFKNFDLGGIQKGIKTEVDKLTREVLEKGGGLKEAAKLLKERRGQIVGGLSINQPYTLNDLSERERKGREIEAFYNKQLNPQRSHAGGGSHSRTRDDGKAERDAQLAFQRSLSEQAIAIAKAEADARRGVLDLQLSDDLISIKDFYAKRRQIERDQLKLELANQQDIATAEQKKLAEIQANLPRLLKSAKPADRAGVEGKALADQLNIKSQIAATEARITEISIKSGADRAKAARDEVQALKALRDSVFEVRKEFLLLSGDSATAGIEETTKRANEQIKKLLVNGQIIAALQAAQNRDIKNSRSVAGGIGEKVSDVQRDADLVRLKIQNDLRLGIIGEGQARKETLKLEEDLRDVTADLLQKQLKAATAGRDSKAIADLQRQIELLRILGQDEDALRAKRAKSGFLNDKSFVDTAQKEAGDVRLRSQETTAKQIIALEDQIAHSAEGSADRARLAWLQANRDIQSANEKASDEFIQNRLKLQHNLDVDPSRLNDGVVKLLASQKTLQESFQDFRANTVSTVFDGINAGVDKMTERFGVAGKAISQLLKDLLKLAATKLFEKIFGINTQQQPAFAGAGGGGQQRSGFNLGSFLGVGSGGGGGGGSFLTPAFNPSGGGSYGGGGGAASGGSGGGIGSILSKIPLIGKLFGGGAQTASAAATTAASGAGDFAGALNAISGGAGGAAKAGGLAGFLGKIPLIGSLFGGGGGGGAAAAGGIGKSLFGGAGFSIAGPVGLALGATLTFLPLLIKARDNKVLSKILTIPFLLNLFGGKSELARFQKEVESAYQIKVKGKEGEQLFGQIKSLGEASFGKPFKNHIAETIRLEQAKQLIAAYGESTNQTQSELVKRTIATREIGSETNSANQFARRAFGGPVSAGQSYVVGDGGRSEVFSPSVGGVIHPSTEAYSQSFMQQVLQSLQSGKVLGGIFAGIRAKLVAQVQAQLNSATPANVQFNADRNASKQQTQNNQADQGNAGQEKLIQTANLLAGAVNELSEGMKTFTTAKPNDILQKTDAKLIAQKTNEGLSGNASAKQDLQRNLGI